MLSAEFGSIAIDEVIVTRDSRVRRIVTPEAVSALADSISRKGLIHPITLRRDRVLVAGETRLSACAALGWTHIPFQFLDTLSEEDCLEIELEENVKRSDLPWQDQCDALRRLHELHVAREPTWSATDTAKSIGYTPQHVNAQLAVAKELASGNERIRAAKEYSTARGIVTRQNERRSQDELRTLTLLEDDDADEVSTPAPPERILNTDFLSWVETYSGPSFSLIHCDFPYGIGADSFNQSAGGSHGTYSDTEEEYWALVSALCNNKERLLGSAGHIIFWFSMQHYASTLAVLREHFWVDPYPLVWHKSDNKGTLPDPQRGPRRVYEVAFLCSHGDRKIIASVANTFSGPTQRIAGHMSEKSEDMLVHFMRMMVDANASVLDPTCGSASALRAALRIGAARVLGLEINPEFADNARRSLDG